MDIVHRSYAPSLNHTSAKTLFEINTCSKKMDYILIAIVIVAIFWILYQCCKQNNQSKSKNNRNNINNINNQYQPYLRL